MRGLCQDEATLTTFIWSEGILNEEFARRSVYSMERRAILKTGQSTQCIQETGPLASWPRIPSAHAHRIDAKQLHDNSPKLSMGTCFGLFECAVAFE